MDRNSRIIVEAIKAAKRITITINPDDKQECVINPNPNKKLHHDIALAVQSFLIEQEAVAKKPKEFKFKAFFPMKYGDMATRWYDRKQDAIKVAKAHLKACEAPEQAYAEVYQVELPTHKSKLIFELSNAEM